MGASTMNNRTSVSQFAPCGTTTEEIQYWQGTSHFIISSEDGLKYFNNTNDAINWLFLSGFKESAREINKQLQGS